MNDLPNRDVVIFTEAADLPADKRAAYLERACGGDVELRQRVEALLHTHDHVGDFLEESPQIATIEARLRDSNSEKPGDQIGPYKLLQQIGEGGCGVVFMAEQETPVRRKVAVKVIKPGMDSRNVIARFEAERQALALMDHPNIAKVLDAGATESGRPFFVMELVRGVKITDYCDQHSLTTSERLSLFIQVSHAVQHAHQKGIIHRDLKPSNILVTTTAEGEPFPKVIDFGIAKATTGQQLTNKTLFTAFEMLIGTPAYMSPEQAAMTNVEADTRTDIYSLGVLLYELLTGTTPFDTQQLLKVGLDEVRRVIREQEPVRPSTRLSTMQAADLTPVARCRKADPPKLIRAVRGDLDWIVMMALEKDPARRYQTANALAQDIQRYLAEETVLARPSSALYKLQKAVARNKLFFAGIGIILILLIAGMAVTTWLLAREKEARREANLARLQAEADKNKATAEAARSGQVTRFLEDMLEGVEPGVALGRDTALLRDILDNTARRVDAELANQPAVQADLKFRLGETYRALWQYDRAETMYRQALAIRIKLFGEENEAVSDVMNSLTKVLIYQGKGAEAEQMIRKTLAVRRRLLGEENVKVADSIRLVGSCLVIEGKLTEAETMSRRALEMERRLLGNQDTRLGDILISLGVNYFDRGEYLEAEEYYRETITNQAPLGENHPYILLAKTRLSSALFEQGKDAEAEMLAREVIATERKFFGGQAPHRLLIFSLNSLANYLYRMGRYEEAEQDYREALGLGQKLEVVTDADFSETISGLVSVMSKQHKLEEVLRLLTSTTQPKAGSGPKPVALLRARCDLLARLGRWHEASGIARALLDQTPDDYGSYHTLAPLLFADTNLSSYRELCREITEHFHGTQNAYVADPMAKDCLILPSAVADLQPVAVMAETAVTGTQSLPPYPFFECCKALAEYRQGHYEGAIKWARAAAQVSFPYSQAEAYATLAMAQYKLKQIEDSRLALAKCAEFVETQMPKIETGDLGGDWRDWIIAHALLNEARNLIEGATASGDYLPNPPNK